MKAGILIIGIWLAWGLAVAHAQAGPDERYVMIYGMIGQADALAEAGQPQQARVEYQAALTELQKFATTYPEWSTNIVTFRKNYLADKIAAAEVVLPAETTAETASPAVPPPTSNGTSLSARLPVSQPVAPDARLSAQLLELQAQVANLQAGNANLTAKLREALAAQPAALDPRELAAAQEQVRSLMKENDLLRVSLARPQHGTATAGLLVASNELAQARQSLAGMSKQLARAMAQAEKLSAANQALEVQTKTLLTSHEGVEALRAENTLLKKQLTEARAAAKAEAAAAAETARKLQAALAQAQVQVAAWQAAARRSDLETVALEAKLKSLETAVVAPSTLPPAAPKVLIPLTASDTAPVLVQPGETLPMVVNRPTDPTTKDLAAALANGAGRIRELEEERDMLRVKLMAATQLWGGDPNRAATNTVVLQLKEQLHALQARLALEMARPAAKP